MCLGAQRSSAGWLTAEKVFYYNKNVTLYPYTVGFWFGFFFLPAVFRTDLKVTFKGLLVCLVVLFLQILLSGGLHSWETKAIWLKH